MWPGAVLILRTLKIEAIYGKRPFPFSSYFGETKAKLKVISWGASPRKGTTSTQPPQFLEPHPHTSKDCLQLHPSVEATVHLLEPLVSKLQSCIYLSSTCWGGDGGAYPKHRQAGDGCLQQIYPLPISASPWESGSIDHLLDIDSSEQGPSFSQRSLVSFCRMATNSP